MLEDFNTLFIPYLKALREASPLASLDTTSLLFFDLDEARAGEESEDDLNTQYAIYLTP